MPEHRHAQGVVDTSVVLSLDAMEQKLLPAEIAISAVTLAELAAGPHATSDPRERARRQDRLQRVEATFDPLPVDAHVARAYALAFASVLERGRTPRGPRAFDLLIAATAMANDLPLYTANASDLAGLGDLLEVVPV